MSSVRTTKATMNELKLRRLQEHNHRLREELARPRVMVSVSAMNLVNFCRSTKDPMVPSTWGPLTKGEDPYAPVEQAGCCSHHLEYLEDEDEDPSDLFGSDPEPDQSDLNTPGPSTFRRPIIPHAIQSTSTGLIPRTRAQDRMKDLREKSRAKMDVSDGRGAASLRACCMTVVRQNRGRIWDVGDMEYGLIKPFLDELPIEQLVEIEEHSPQIRKDTDWIWEMYLLQEFPLFHEGCVQSHGEERKSGWRRMYKKAKTEAMTRQASAAGRVADRYRQLEEEKAAKRIVFVDKVIPTRAKGGFGSRNRSSGTTPKPAASAFGKARADIQRARVALTHASGKYTPPVPAKNRFREDTARLKPARPSTSAYPAVSRLPPPFSRIQPAIPIPRSTSTSSITPRSLSVTTSKSSPTTLPSRSRPSPYASTQYNQARSALPTHLTGLPVPNTKEERFRLPIDHTRQQGIKKPRVESFEPPRPKGVVVDFFGDGPKGSMESLGRTGTGIVKRKRD